MVTRYISVSSRVPIMPTGSRIPSLRSTRYSCGMACSSSRSGGICCARATSCARSTSAREISSPLTATTPVLVIARTCSPAMPTYSHSTFTPDMRSASVIALRMEWVVSSMSETTPRRMPEVRACPTPRILTPALRGRSPTTSAMTAVVLAEPISRPATRRSGFIALWRRLGRGIEDQAPPRAPAGARDRVPRGECPIGVKMTSPFLHEHAAGA